MNGSDAKWHGHTGDLFAVGLSAPHLPVLQLDQALESNKTEKHQKDTFKRLFVASGFTNLDEPSELHKKQAGGQRSGPAAGSAHRSGPPVEDVAWPDLYDVVIDPG